MSNMASCTNLGQLEELDRAIGHLKAVLEGCSEVDYDQYGDPLCAWCRWSLAKSNHHAPDCPYVAAKAFLEAIGQ